MTDNTFQTTGIITHIGKVYFPSKQNRNFCVREFVLECTDSENQPFLILFTLYNTQTNFLTNVGVGYEVSLNYYISCRPWKDKDGNYTLDKHGNKTYFQDLVPYVPSSVDTMFRVIKVHEDRLETKKEETIDGVDDTYFQESNDPLPF
jgi:hypothetical protein